MLHLYAIKFSFQHSTTESSKHVFVKYLRHIDIFRAALNCLSNSYEIFDKSEVIYPKRNELTLSTTNAFYPIAPTPRYQQ
jgi:hypothetical protein